MDSANDDEVHILVCPGSAVAREAARAKASASDIVSNIRETVASKDLSKLQFRQVVF